MPPLRIVRSFTTELNLNHLGIPLQRDHFPESYAFPGGWTRMIVTRSFRKLFPRKAVNLSGSADCNSQAGMAPPLDAPARKNFVVLS